MKTKGINIKLLGIVGIVILLGFATVFFILLVDEYAYFRKDIENRLLTQANLFAGYCVIPLGMGSGFESEFDDIFEVAMSNSSVEAMFVYDERSELYAASQDEYNYSIPIGFSQEYQLQFDGMLVHVSRSIEYESLSIGTLHYIVSVEELYQRINNRILNIGLALLMAMLAIFSILLFFLRMTITEPIEKLSQTMSNITEQRNWNLRSDHDREDEIGGLQLSFNNLIKAIQKNEDQREIAVHEIERLRLLLSNIINSITSILIGVDKQNNITHWNREAEKSTGNTASEMLGRKLDSSVLALDEIENVRVAVIGQFSYHRRKSILTTNGEQIIVEVDVHPLVDDEVGGAVVRIDDITEKSHLEEMMIQSEKMLSVGGLAAGMAHEINNPLAGILQNLQVLINRLSPELPKNIQVAEECGTSITSIQKYFIARDLYNMLDDVLGSGKRAAEIVSNVLSFSKKSQTTALECDVVELMEKSIDLASSDYNLKNRYDFRSIKISRKYADFIPLVKCNPASIQQVLLNIIRNAAEALSTAQVAIEDPELIFSVSSEDDSVVMAIEDNGPGMPESVRRRVFEPFFTTKELDKGTGLGLSVSYFIIAENHNGDLRVTSSESGGTKFLISLPLRKDIEERSN